MANKKFNALITIGGAVASSLKTAIGSTTSQLGQIGKEIRRVKRDQDQLGSAIQTFGRMGKNVDNLRTKYSTVTAELGRLTKAQERLTHVEEARLKNQEKFNEVKGQIGAALATAVTVGAPIKMAADFETSMLGVAKQLDGARDSSGKLTKDFFGMRQEILQLGRTMPVTNNELAEMVGSGLKMGVAKQDIIGFTKEVVKMGTAFELPYDQLAEDMGKIANMYKRPIKDIGELADTINFLDDNALSAGKDIIEFMQRVGGTASMVGITDKNTAALGSTLLTLGERTETASTAINAVFSKLGAASTQSKPFKSMLNELGLEAHEVGNMMQKDAVGGILAVMDAISKLPKESTMEKFWVPPKTGKNGEVIKPGYFSEQASTTQIDAVSTLFGAEHWDTFSKLLQNRGELEKQLKLGNSTGAKGSMDKEFQARMETTQAQWSVFKNTISEGMINIGSVLLPIINDIMGKVGGVITKFVDWSNENPKLTSTIVKTVATLGALKIGFLVAKLAIFAIKSPLLKFSDGLKDLSDKGFTVSKVFKTLKTTIPGLASGFFKLKNIISSTAGSIFKFATSGNVFKTVFGRIGQIATGSLNLIKGAFMGVFSTIGRFKTFIVGSAQSIVKFATSGNVVRTVFGGVGNVLKQVGLALLRTPWGAVAAVAIGACLMIYKYWDYIKAFFQGFWTGLKQGIEPFTSAVGKLIQSTPLLSQAWNLVSGAISKVFTWFKNLLTPVQATKEGIGQATSVGEKFGKLVGGAINLVLTPLKVVVNLFGWIINNVSKIGSAWTSVKSFFGGSGSSQTPSSSKPLPTPPPIARAPLSKVITPNQISNSFTIHAAPGQNPKEIAAEAVKLMNRSNGIAMRSSMLDAGYSQ